MDRRLVRKSNYLIEASYKLSAVEQKIILILASMIKPEDREFKKYLLKISNIAQVIGLNSNNDYTYIKASTQNLLSKVFTITTPESELQTHWFSSVEYFEARGDVEFTFDPKLKPFLLQLKERFTTYHLQEAVQLKSSFSIRMLELLRQYEKLGERTFEVRTLRNLLGVEDHQYKLYADFKKRVILAAQKELAAKTNISFEFTEIKNGYAVEKLRFKIIPATRETAQTVGKGTPELVVDPELDRLALLLPEQYRSKDSVRKLLAGQLKKSGFDFVARNIAYANEKSNASTPGTASGKPANYRNYLAKALQGDFGLAFQEDQEARRAVEEVRRQAEKAAAHERKLHDDKLRIERENHERARVYQESLTPESLAALREEATARLDSQQQELLRRKAHGSELLLKVSMTRICLERMKLSQPA